MTTQTHNLREVAANDPDPEVTEKASRRVFTASYKRSILEQAENCKQPGELGALLRREGLYSSHLAKWLGKASRVSLGRSVAPRPSRHRRSEFNSSSGR